MKNVKLFKPSTGKGWFLTIGDDINNTWAVSSLELWALHKIIQDNMETIKSELKENETKT